MKFQTLPKTCKKGALLFNWLKQIKEDGAATPSPFGKQTTFGIIPIQKQGVIIIQALLTGPKTSIELRDNFGILNPSARINRLKKAFNIKKINIKIFYKGAWRRNVAKYILIQGPLQ